MRRAAARRAASAAAAARCGPALAGAAARDGATAAAAAAAAVAAARAAATSAAARAPHAHGAGDRGFAASSAVVQEEKGRAPAAPAAAGSDLDDLLDLLQGEVTTQQPSQHAPQDARDAHGARAEVPSQPQLRHAPDAQAVDFLPFEEARQKARQLVNLHDVTSELEYKEAVAMRMEGTEGLPLHADFYYLRKGWQYWEDFLGQPGDHGVWLEYEEARRAVLDAGVQSEAQFRELLMANDPRLRGVPINPATGYKNSGWISWHAWLGKGVKQNFEGAKRAVRPLCLKDREHFELLLKRGLLPAGMPTDPYMQYKKDFYKTHKTESYDGFWEFFLKGNYDRSDPEALQPKQLPYLTSRRYLERYVKPKITTPEEYAQWAAEDESERGKWEGKVPRPLSVPFKPEEAYYRRGWRTWVDFLGMEDPDARWAVKLMQRRQRREYKALKIEERGIKPHDDLLKKVMHMVDGPYLPTEQDKEDDEMVTLAGYDSEKGREEESFDEEDEETEHNQRA